MLLRTIISIAFVLAVGVSSTAAAIDDRAAAKREYNEGTRLYEVAEFAKALESFKKAYLHFEEPALLFNMAQCYRQLGQRQEAVRFYRTYLRKIPNAPNRVEVEKMIASLEETGGPHRRSKEGVH